MRAKIWLTMAVTLGLSLPTATAYAGGGAMLDFDQEYAKPGDTVSGSGIVWLKPSTPGLGRLKDGPYFAYLSTSGSWKNKDDLVRLAPLQIKPRVQGQHGRVSVAFTLPQLDPGYYWLRYCNESCKKPLGDLMPQQLNVVADKSEARVLDLSLRIAEEVSRAKTRLRREARISDRGISAELRRLEIRLSEVEERLNDLDERDQSSANTLPFLPAAVIAVPLGLIWWRRRSKN